ENRLAAAGCVRMHDLIRLGDGGFFASLQIDTEGRAVTGFANDGDVAARLLDEAEDHAETETSALAFLFGGEEGLENAAEELRLHPRTGVVDFDEDVLSGRYRPVHRDAAAVKADTLSPYCELTAIGHG